MPPFTRNPYVLVVVDFPTKHVFECNRQNADDAPPPRVLRWGPARQVPSVLWRSRAKHASFVATVQTISVYVDQTGFQSPCRQTTMPADHSTTSCRTRVEDIEITRTSDDCRRRRTTSVMRFERDRTSVSRRTSGSSSQANENHVFSDRTD